MKIILADFKHSGGVATLSEIFTTYFAKQGHSVDILASKESFLQNCQKLTRSHKLIWIFLDCINPFLIWKILRTIKSSGAEIIYFMSSHPLNSVITFLARIFLPKLYIVSHIHDPNPYNKPLISKIVKAYQKMQLRYSHQVICFGNSIKKYIQEDYKIPADRISVIRHGPVPPRNREQCVNEAECNYKYFTMIGRLENYKGIPVFLEAAKILNEQNKSKDVEFVLAGTGDLSLCKASISNLPNLTVANRFITNEEINHYMRQSYAFVMPYIGGMLSSGFISVAYYNKCPVIVSSIGCLPESVIDNETGFVVEPSNPEELANAMEKMLNTKLRSKMADSCWQYYKSNSQWDSILSILESKLESAIKTLKGT